MTTPNGVAPTGDQPTLSELLTAHARTVALQETINVREETLRAQIGEAIQASPDDLKSLNVKVPGVGKVATAAVYTPGVDVRVTDEDAYADDVELHHHTEVLRTLTLELPTGFGYKAARDAVLAALAPLIAAGQVKGTREEREVRAAYRKNHLKKNANPATGKLEEPSKDTGEFRVVPGVEVKRRPATGRFALNWETPDAKTLVRRQLADDVSALVGLIGGRPAEVTDSKVIAGEAEDVEAAS